MGNVDCGTDDTVFPKYLADQLGIDLNNPPAYGESAGIGGTPVQYPYARVLVRVSDGSEACEWEATVGFVDLPLALADLGPRWLPEFFDAQLLGQRRQLILMPNRSFRGRQAFRRRR